MNFKLLLPILGLSLTSIGCDTQEGSTEKAREITLSESGDTVAVGEKVFAKFSSQGFAKFLTKDTAMVFSEYDLSICGITPSEPEDLENSLDCGQPIIERRKNTSMNFSRRSVATLVPDTQRFVIGTGKNSDGNHEVELWDIGGSAEETKLRYKVAVKGAGQPVISNNGSTWGVVVGFGSSSKVYLYNADAEEAPDPTIVPIEKNATSLALTPAGDSFYLLDNQGEQLEDGNRELYLGQWKKDGDLWTEVVTGPQPSKHLALDIDISASNGDLLSRVTNLESMLETDTGGFVNAPEAGTPIKLEKLEHPGLEEKESFLASQVAFSYDGSRALMTGNIYQMVPKTFRSGSKEETFEFPEEKAYEVAIWKKDGTGKYKVEKHLKGFKDTPFSADFISFEGTDRLIVTASTGRGAAVYIYDFSIND